MTRETTVRLLERFGQVWLNSLARRRAVGFDTDKKSQIRYVLLERKRELDFSRSLQRGDETGGTGLVMVTREDKTIADVAESAMKTKGLFQAYRQKRGRAGQRAHHADDSNDVSSESHREKLLDGMEMLPLPGVKQAASDKARSVVEQPGTFGTQFLASVTASALKGTSTRPRSKRSVDEGSKQPAGGAPASAARAQPLTGGNASATRAAGQGSDKRSFAAQLQAEMDGRGMHSQEQTTSGNNGGDGGDTTEDQPPSDVLGARGDFGAAGGSGQVPQAEAGNAADHIRGFGTQVGSG